MFSNNPELSMSHFHEFVQAKMASLSKLPLAKVLFRQSNSQQTTVSIESCVTNVTTASLPLHYL